MATPNDIPAREYLPLKEQVISFGFSAIKNIGKVVLAAAEGALDGAISSATIEIEECIQEHDERNFGLAMAEEYANDPEAYEDY